MILFQPLNNRKGVTIMSYAIDLFLAEEMSNEDFIDQVFDYVELCEECLELRDQDDRENSVSYKLFQEEL